MLKPTDGGVAWERERVDVRGRLHVLDAAVAVLNPEADGVVQVGQVIGQVLVDRGLVVEAANAPRCPDKVLETPVGSCQI